MQLLYNTSFEVEETLHAWVSAQIMRWEGKPPRGGDVLAELEARNRVRQDIFVFDIAGGLVTTRAKPVYDQDALFGQGPLQAARAAAYRGFLQSVVTQNCPQLACAIGMSMHDQPSEHADIPLFAFQKRRGRNEVLLPDIDAVLGGFHAGQVRDEVGFDEKQTKGVFVGSTTGAVHTVDSVKQLGNPRLSLAVRFRGSPDVDFHLPNIAQCADEAAVEAIRALGIGGAFMPWESQYRYKFILSVDGNGATCSRVAIALASNSVLVKRHSEHELYYFGGLIPFRHYIPFDDAEGVLAVIEAERRHPGSCRPIAAAGQAFFQRYLTVGPAMKYTAMLLTRYAACVFGPAGAAL